jgi:exopolyphosphatase/guanosine-5'-triphosphate,3'-diphosphate pyrophosphatase
MTDGVLVDIGGGSTELVFYKSNRMLRATSMPVGSLNMYSRHVEKLFPTKRETAAIKNEVEKYLKEFQSSEPKYKLICGVGGTVRAACKLNNEVYDMPVSNRTLDIKSLNDILKLIKNNDKESLSLILKTAPDRIHTIIPGMTILKTVADHFDSETIIVSEYGVREGYLFHKLISDGVIYE